LELGFVFVGAAGDPAVWRDSEDIIAQWILAVR